MKQHYLKGIFLCLCLFTGINTFAYDAVIDGIYYNFSGDEATVTYKEENEYGFFSDYTGSVVIPASVTYNDKTYNVTSIGAYAFMHCGLTSITIPNSVTIIDYNAFYDCFLTSITIPNSVTSIEYAFSECQYLTSIQVESGNTVYDSRNNCNAIIETETNTLIAGCKNTIIPNSVTSIGGYAFEGCGLTSFTIPNNVTSIGGWAFANCDLTSVTIPNNVTSIGGNAFWGCGGLTSIQVESGNTVYDSRNNCNAIIETETNTLIVGCQNTIIPNSVTSIGGWAFNNCNSLTSITIPNSVTSIGGYAFYNCNSLTSITIPNSVTSIGGYAFQDCGGLSSITIPNSVTNIEEYAFDGCSSLTTVKVDIETPLPITADAFSNRANAVLIVPDGCKSAYEAADYWNEFKEILEESVVITIGSTGYATYCSENDLDFSDVSGLNAYIASGFSPSTGKLVLTRVTEVPAGEGLYLVGDAGTYEVPFTETDMIYSNLLRGVTTATTISPTDGSYTNFILANGEHGVAFYSLSEAGELAAGKAYLQLPTASVPEVKAIRVIFDDDEDAIQSIAEESQTERIYNLQGQQVNAPKSGLYIVNGKKVFIK